MSNPVETCVGRQGCTSEVTHACNCGNPIVFLCKDCVADHISEPGYHTFISLGKTRELIKNDDLRERYHQDYAKYISIQWHIKNYISSLEIYTDNLIRSKPEVIRLVEQEYQAKLEYLSSKRSSAVAQLENVKERLKNFTPGYDEIFFKYDTNNLLEDYIVSFEVNIHEFQHSLQRIFQISSNETIYHAREDSTQIRTYNIAANKIDSINLGTTIVKKFKNTSTCILPNGNVVIVGGMDPCHGDTYVFCPETRQSTKLNPMNIPRGYVGLVCHDRYLYAFGGLNGHNGNQISRSAERMELGLNGWTNLPNMKKARARFG
jgi:hypothetical protein